MKSALGSISSLLDELENKNDPEPIEIEIVSTAYQLLEKLNLLQAAMRKYSNDYGTLTGSKLDSLYSNDGILVDD
jgi:hypothetical protein